METEFRWIKSGSQKAVAIRAFLREVQAWRHGCYLGGGSSDYDAIPGCYGSPDSDIVFLAEIPSLGAVKRAVERAIREGCLPENLWKTQWNVSRGDKMFRRALLRHELIPDVKSEEPWDWKCWITDVVKCPETDKIWKELRKDDRGKWESIVKQGCELLKSELQIINPKLVVLMGNVTTDIFLKHFPYSDHLHAHLSHYQKRGLQEQEYIRQFAAVMGQYNRAKSSGDPSPRPSYLTAAPS